MGRRLDGAIVGNGKIVRIYSRTFLEKLANVILELIDVLEEKYLPS